MEKWLFQKDHKKHNPVQYIYVHIKILFLMEKQQFNITVINNEISEKSGHFFKVAPFTITVHNTTYNVRFERRGEGKVFFIITHNNQELFLLDHPDYVPECSFEDLKTFSSNQDAQTIFYALCKLGISIQKDYLKWIDSNTDQQFSYSISQPLFI